MPVSPATKWPSPSVRVRPPSASATSSRVVATISAAPSRWMRESSASTSRALRASSAPVGSSASTTAGRLTIARAIAARCFSPNDSSAG